jgi:hypothetical protein
MKLNVVAAAMVAVLSLMPLAACRADEVAATALESKPWTPACLAEADTVSELADRRDLGLPRARAQALAQRVGESALPQRSVTLVFDWPRLSGVALSRYALWSCHAMAHGVPVQPMKDVAVGFEACHRSAGPLTARCDDAMWNQVLGLPEDRLVARPAVRPVADVPVADLPPDVRQDLCEARRSPEYPIKARRDGVTGKVDVVMRIENGQVTTLLSITGPEVFHPAVRLALRGYRCKVLDRPVVVTTSFTFAEGAES